MDYNKDDIESIVTNIIPESKVPKEILKHYQKERFVWTETVLLSPIELTGLRDILEDVEYNL